MTGGNRGARHAAALLFIIAAAGAALRFAVLGFSLTGEEAAALSLAGKHGFAALFSAARATAQQPFYYAAAHVWIHIFGDGIIAARVLSAIIGTLWIPLVYTLGARLFRSRGAGLTAAALAAISPLAVFVSRIAGPYAMFVAVVLAANIALLGLFEEKIKPRAFIWYAALVIAMVFTHAHGAAVMTFHCIFAYFQRKKSMPFLFKRVAPVAVLVMMAFVIWGHRSFPLAHEVWSPPLLPANIEPLQYFLFLISPGMAFASVPAPALAREAFTTLFVFSLFLALFGALWARRLKTDDPPRVKFLTAHLIVPILLCIPTMMLAQSPPMWRHAAFLAPAVWLLCAYALNGGRSAAARAIFIIILLIVNITGLQSVLRAPGFPFDWNGAGRHIREHERAHDTVLNLVPYMQPRINHYYFSGRGINTDSIHTVNQGSEIELAADVVISEKAFEADCFWIVYEDKKDTEPGAEMLQAYFTREQGRTLRGPFTAPALRVERLCLDPDARYLRALSKEKFIEFLMMPPHEGKDLDRRFERVTFFFDSGSMDLAERELHGVEKKYGRRPDVSLTLCAVELERGKRSNKIKAFERAARCVRFVRGGDRREADVLLGEALFHIGRLGDAAKFEQALPLFESVVADKKFCRRDNRDRCARAAYFAGEILLRKHNVNRAEYYFKKAVSEPETGATAVYNLSLIYVQQERYNDALEQLPTLMGHERYGSAASFLIGLSLYKLGRYQQAEPHLKALLQHPEYGKDAQKILSEIKKKTAPIPGKSK